MNVAGIIWLKKIVDKLANKHHITQDEVEQVFINNPQYRFLEQGEIEDEHVYSAYGQTDSGRYVTVIFIRKFGNRALVISARDMDKKERKQYGK
jgi:uncharacterized DUF497 family protein